MGVSGRFLFEFFTPRPENPLEFVFPPLAPTIHLGQILLMDALGVRFGDPRVPGFLQREHDRQLQEYLKLVTPTPAQIEQRRADEANRNLADLRKQFDSQGTPSTPNKLLVDPPGPTTQKPATQKPNKLLVDPPGPTTQKPATTTTRNVIDMPDVAHMDDPPPKR